MWKLAINDGAKLILNEIEIILTKREIGQYEQFLHLPQCFRKSSAAQASEMSL